MKKRKRKKEKRKKEKEPVVLPFVLVVTFWTLRVGGLIFFIFGRFGRNLLFSGKGVCKEEERGGTQGGRKSKQLGPSFVKEQCENKTKGSRKEEMQTSNEECFSTGGGSLVLFPGGWKGVRKDRVEKEEKKRTV